MRRQKGNFNIGDLFGLVAVYVMFYAFLTIWNPITTAMALPDNTPYISLINLAFALLPALTVFMWLSGYIRRLRTPGE